MLLRFFATLVLAFTVLTSAATAVESTKEVAVIKEDTIVVKFEGSIVPQETFGLVMQLGLLQGQDIALFITSPGGIIDLAYDIAEVMKRHGRVDCYVLKEVDSAAFQIILPACRTRTALRSSKFGFHQTHAGFGPGTPMMNSAMLRRIADSLDMSTEMMLRFVSEVLATPEEVEKFRQHLDVQDQPDAVTIQKEFPSFLTRVVDSYKCEGPVAKMCEEVLK